MNMFTWTYNMQILSSVMIDVYNYVIMEGSLWLGEQVLFQPHERHEKVHDLQMPMWAWEDFHPGFGNVFTQIPKLRILKMTWQLSRVTVSWHLTKLSLRPLPAHLAQVRWILWKWRVLNGKRTYKHEHIHIYACKHVFVHVNMIQYTSKETCLEHIKSYTYICNTEKRPTSLPTLSTGGRACRFHYMPRLLWSWHDRPGCSKGWVHRVSTTKDWHLQLPNVAAPWRCKARQRAKPWNPMAKKGYSAPLYSSETC